MNTIKIAIGKSEKSKALTHKEVSWQQIVKKYSTHKVAAKKGGEFVVGGYFYKDLREGEYLVARTLLVIDIDKYSGSIEDLEFDLSLLPYGFVAYSSFQHTSDKPRVRVIAPLSREVTAEEYRVMAHQACLDMPIPLEAIDKCSWTPNQAMFAPQHAEGADHWTMTQDGEAFSVPDVVAASGCISIGVGGAAAVGGSDDDLMAELARTPLDITEAEVDAYLAAYHADGLDYDGWLEVGMALWHQSQGEWLDKWIAWSEQSPKHDASQMKMKWRSFGGSPKPITMATVKMRVQSTGAIVTTHKGWIGKIESCDDAHELERLAKREIALDRSLSAVDAAKIEVSLKEQFDALGVTIPVTAIRKMLRPSKRPIVANVDAPDWLAPWVYVQKQCSFHNTELGYSIKREAFNATYDRECVAVEKPAHIVATVDYSIRTVVDEMFFPGADKFFSWEGMPMLNSYSQRGVEPCESLDPEGAAVVDRFMRHLDFTFELESERKIFLDWMAYIYQNPGKRVGWAMLLQGAQGTGKSYFGNVFELLMGTNCKSLATGAIAGQFTGWAHGSLVTVVEEIRIAGTNKWEILDKLKPIISNTAIQIEEKGRDHRTVPNFTSYLLLTNHKDAVPVVDGDRRYCCLFSRVQSEEQLFGEMGGKGGVKAYFDSLFDDTRARPDAIARMLLDHKISAGFDPIGRAPETSARTEMQGLTVSPERDIIEDAISEFECAVINSRILDVTWLNKLAEGNGVELPKTRTVSSILLEMGYHQIEGRRVKLASGKLHYVWSSGAQCFEEVRTIVRNYHKGEMDNFEPEMQF